MLLTKNLQFLTKSYETLSFGRTSEVVIWAKFHKISIKIVDFSLIAISEASLRFYWLVFKNAMLYKSQTEVNDSKFEFWQSQKNLTFILRAFFAYAVQQRLSQCFSSKVDLLNIDNLSHSSKMNSNSKK